MINGQTKAARNFQATHPNQAVRKILDFLDKKAKSLYLTLLIMNEQGFYWVYSVKKKTDQKYHAIVQEKSERFLSERLVAAVFSGRTRIVEVSG